MATPSFQPPPLSRIEKVLITLDAGSSYGKAMYRVFRAGENAQPRLCQDRMMMKLEPITWEHGDAHVPTQLAYRPPLDPTQLHWPQLWGMQVNNAVDTGVISREDVIKDLKLLLFKDGEDIISQQAERHRVRKYMRELRNQDLLPPLPSVITQINETGVHEFLGLYSDFLRHAYLFVVGRIRNAYPEVNFDEIVVEVAIPLPVKCSPDEVELILAAVKAAGIPNPFVVGEPTAALAHHFQLSFERYGILPQADCTLILDIGGGSSDIQGWANVGISPFRVQEMCAGDTKWCGGLSVNKKCVDLVLRGIMDKGFVKRHLRSKGRDMTDYEFRRALEEKFEETKKFFNGSDSVGLPVPGLPDMESYRMPGGDKVVLDLDDMRRIFGPALDSLRNMIMTALRELARRYEDNGIASPQIELLLVGGGSLSPYLTQQIKTFCSDEGRAVLGRPISVSVPNSSSSTAVASGSLLLLMDKAFITKRIITRGYCMAWDKDIRLLQNGVDDVQPVARDPHDGVMSALEVTKFFVRPGDCIPVKHAVRHRGWRGLFREEGRNGGWEFLEHLYRSDTIRDDDVWVNRPGIDIHLMPHPLRFLIPFSLSDRFIPRLSPDGRTWYRVEYEVALVLDGMRAIYELVVPRTGKFSKPNKRVRDEGYIVQRGQFDINGVFQLFN
ncbi:hypothetical protein PV04_02346 [Phialophora macrospora]|uniref:Actin-like ATPase domain-containing protein n=1 Tax=Phialophora macrospora TaxID=1851006 RepID=A0A0D2FU50_9EURO|nr:hypothetical protein PV04_02346 [Phialophora macrospora]